MTDLKCGKLLFGLAFAVLETGVGSSQLRNPFLRLRLLRVTSTQRSLGLTGVSQGITLDMV